MDREEALQKANDAKDLSQQGLQLIQQGKYREGHNLMRQAVEAGRECRQFLKQPKIERGLTIQGTNPRTVITTLLQLMPPNGGYFFILKTQTPAFLLGLNHDFFAYKQN